MIEGGQIAELPEGMRVIKTEEEARQVLDEMKAQNEAMQDPKLQKLENQKRLNEALAQMDKIWKTMSRRQKRGVIKPKFKYNNVLKSRLKSIDIQHTKTKKQTTTNFNTQENAG